MSTRMQSKLKREARRERHQEQSSPSLKIEADIELVRRRIDVMIRLRLNAELQGNTTAADEYKRDIENLVAFEKELQDSLARRMGK